MTNYEAELDAIRIKLYEETQNLTNEEKNKHLREKGRKLAEQFGFIIVSSIHESKIQQDAV